MTSYSYSGELLKGLGELQSLQQYNLRVGEVKGKVEGVERKGMGSEWSLQTCQLHITPRVSDLFLRKSEVLLGLIINFGGAKALRPDLQGVRR